jgi:hypothetical protein
LSEDLQKFATAERVWLRDEGGISEFTPEEQTEIIKMVILAYFLSFSALDVQVNLECSPKPDPGVMKV